MGPDIEGAKPPSVCPAPSRTEGTWRFIGRTSSFRGRSDLGLHWRCQVVDLVYLPELFPPPTSHSLTPPTLPTSPPSRPQPTLGPTSLTSPGYLPIHLDRRLSPPSSCTRRRDTPQSACLSGMSSMSACLSCKLPQHPANPSLPSSARRHDRPTGFFHTATPSSPPPASAFLPRLAAAAAVVIAFRLN